MEQKIQVVGFDADDTLWPNQPYYDQAEEQFFGLFPEDYTKDCISQQLFKTEMANLSLYGYGAKSFILSMIETADRILPEKDIGKAIKQIIEIGKPLIDMPVNLLPGVKKTLDALKGKYKLVMVTKGDLLDQHRKLDKSGLKNYFDYIGVLKDKKEEDYQNFFHLINCNPPNFLMIGNSIKSDIIPILKMGGFGAYVPFHATWEYEKYDGPVNHDRMIEIKQVDEILEYLNL